MRRADLLPVALSSRSRSKDYVRFSEKGGDDDEVGVQRVIAGYFKAFNEHAPARMLAHCSPGARFNVVVPTRTRMTASQFLKSLERSIHYVLGAYFDGVWVEFDGTRTRARARGSYSLLRNGPWQTRVATELTLLLRRGDDGWKITLHDTKAPSRL